uniref:Uncharacterized protein n=1 Tax=Tetradesmus obliquus TaxID=3088 RepID=A0A383V8J8_TETOB
MCQQRRSERLVVLLKAQGHVGVSPESGRQAAAAATAAAAAGDMQGVTQLARLQEWKTARRAASTTEHSLGPSWLQLRQLRGARSTFSI